MLLPLTSQLIDPRHQGLGSLQPGSVQVGVEEVRTEERQECEEASVSGEGVVGE